MNINKYLLPFFTALVLTYITTPIAEKIAHKVGAIDVPKDNRRVHKKPIPRLGGLAIYFSTMFSFIIFSFFEGFILDKSIISIMAGATIIVITGIIDDIKPISAKIKLVAQILAAIVLIAGGVKIDFLSNPFVRGYSLIHLEYLAIPATIFWVVGITNTLNLIDGLDGLAAGVGGIASISLLFVASQFIDLAPLYSIIMIMSAILAGASFGFLPHNFNPARIFMGDTGSLFLGYMLAVISIKGVMKSFTAVSVVLPVVILGLPIFDTSFAILRRFINKRPIMKPDKGHLHHRLLARGLTQKQTVLILYIICIGLGTLALLITEKDAYRSAIILGTGLVLVSLLGTQVSMLDVKEKRNVNNRE